MPHRLSELRVRGLRRIEREVETQDTKYTTPAFLVALLVACCWLGMVYVDLGRARGGCLGNGPVDPCEVLLCPFRFVAQVMQRLTVLMLCSLNLPIICSSCWPARLESRRISYHSDDRSPDGC